MRKKIGIIACGLVVMTIAAAAQAAKPKEERRTVTMVLDHTVLNLEYEFVPAAEAMPEDKFGFAPTDGARSPSKSNTWRRSITNSEPRSWNRNRPWTLATSLDRRRLLPRRTF